ncbi:unnamed protein product [Vitrella brassicaformis CCMP3155]|uniref:Ribosomal protein L17 n=1 Tax=Vitrella brassicaformis (strain CCMP3155) TaxID=1169540 RepID=A0A0G4E978_VITBC|nr:unnamed protein product [Vitrella brassicaformis CCMP3155]|eukprot:CEL91787.1 unnamed protein product [Vitrella brassicaformis CCMP3155]
MKCAAAAIFIALSSVLRDAAAFVVPTPLSLPSRQLSLPSPLPPSPSPSPSRNLLTMKAHPNFRKGNTQRLGRAADQRKALLRSLTTACLKYGSIRTTEAKAKQAARHVDKMIGLAKRGDLHAFRQALGWLYDKDLTFRVFEAAPARYAERRCGYTRVKLIQKQRKGDNARMAILELV